MYKKSHKCLQENIMHVTNNHQGNAHYNFIRSTIKRERKRWCKHVVIFLQVEFPAQFSRVHHN